MSEKIANIDLNRSLINVIANFIQGGFINDDHNYLKEKNILFSLPTFTVRSGQKILETPIQPEYLPIRLKPLREINLQVVDKYNQLYDFRGDEILIKLHIKQV